MLILRRLAIVLLLLLTLPGCTAYEALFCAFEDAYSGGGSDSLDRRAHYDAEIEKWSE